VTKILLKFYVRLESHDVKFSPNGPLFHRYMPDGKNEAITLDIRDRDFILKVWLERRGFVRDGMIEFDIQKTEVDPAIIPKQAVLDGGPLSCLLEMNGMSAHQVELVRNEKIGDADFIKLGKEIAHKIEPAINNFLNIIRIKYGQYWIQNLKPFDSRRSSIGGYFSSLETKYSLDDGKTWKKFHPDQPSHTAHVMMGGDYHYYLSKEDWLTIRTVSNDKFDPSVAMNCLVQAHQYMDQGALKHAIIEGVTALELSIEEFFQRKLEGNETLIKKLGEFKQLHLPTKTTMISASIGISGKELEDVLEIIEIRNNIAHRGISIEEFAVRKKLQTLLNIVSTLVFGTKYRFPGANHGNSLKTAEEWEKNNRKITNTE
jgi:hypothetical protein